MQKHILTSIIWVANAGTISYLANAAQGVITCARVVDATEITHGQEYRYSVGLMGKHQEAKFFFFFKKIVMYYVSVNAHESLRGASGALLSTQYSG